MALLFRQTKMIEGKLDQFLDAVAQGALLFQLGIKDYLAGEGAEFEARIKAVSDLERIADELRHDIETQLYAHSLIPEHRGDVLGLLETIDDVIDTEKKTLSQFEVERPAIPYDLNPQYQELANACAAAVEAVVAASRAFFRDLKAVHDHLHKVYFFEKEADRLSDRLKRDIFGRDLDLAHKIHLRYFSLHIENLSDEAERVADRLAISTIKRTM
jgi:uncharacterized protein